MTNDMSATIVPKSDQMNTDDLITGPRTIKITGVDIRAGDQPVSIHYEGGEGKPWKPSKGMRRILVEAWGNDSAAYVGRSATLVRDPTIRFGKDEVGGIRISHLSHIEGPIRTPLTVSKGKRVPYSVEPLVGGPPAAKKKAATPEEKAAAAKKTADAMVDEINAAVDEAQVKAILTKHADMLARLATVDVKIPANVNAAATMKIGQFDVKTPEQPALIPDTDDKR